MIGAETPTVYCGKVKDGKIELDPSVRLPEEPDPADDLSSGAVDMGPSDLAHQHNHSLYGTPKRNG